MKKLSVKNISLIVAAVIILIRFGSEPFGLLTVMPFVYLLVQAIFELIRRRSAKRFPDEAAARQHEKKTARRLYNLSFIPFLLFVLYCFSTMITGFDAGWITSHYVYGTDALLNSFIFGGLALCIVPVFPAMLIYQIVYNVKYRRRKSKGKEAAGS